MNGTIVRLTVLARIDAKYIRKQIRRMEDAIESDPELVIGTAKEFLQTICRTIAQLARYSAAGG